MSAAMKIGVGAKAEAAASASSEDGASANAEAGAGVRVGAEMEVAYKGRFDEARSTSAVAANIAGGTSVISCAVAAEATISAPTTNSFP